MYHVGELAGIALEGFGSIAVDADHGLDFARYGVGEVASVDFSYGDSAEAIEAFPEETRHLLAGVATSETDLHARVAAFEVVEMHAIEALSAGSCRAFVGKLDDSYLAAGTADDELTMLFGVEIQQNVAADESWLQAVGADQSLLFINSEEAFHRAVHERVVEQSGHCRGTAHAVVGSEGGAVSLYPFAVHDSCDRVNEEIVLFVSALFSHHILMALEYDARSILVSGCSRFAHHYIAHLIGGNFYVVSVGPVYQELLHLFKMMGGTGHFCDFVEALPYELRLKVSNFHEILMLFEGNPQGADILFLFEAGVCGGHLGVIATAGIACSVVFPGESRPVFSPQIVEHTGIAYERCKELKLFELGIRHQAHKFIDRLASACLVVESSDLEHSPEGAHIRPLGVDAAGIDELRPFASGISGKPGRYLLPFGSGL